MDQADQAAAAANDQVDSDAKFSWLDIVDTLCTLSWFAMDASWMLGLVGPAKVLAISTIALSVLTFLFIERTRANALVTLSMTCWAGMNVCWMLKDLQLYANGLTFAYLFLAGGILSLIFAGKGAVTAVLSRFRRSRIPRT